MLLNYFATHMNLGKYAMQFVLVGNNVVQYLMVALLFCIPLHRKQRLFFPVLLSVLLSLAVWGISVWIRTDGQDMATRIISGLMLYLFTLPMMMLCFTDPMERLLKTWCSAIAVKEIVGTIYPTLQFFLGYDSHTTIQLLPIANQPAAMLWGVYYGVHFLLYLLLYLLVGRKAQEPYDASGRRAGVALSVSAILVLGVLGSVASAYRDDSAVLYICTRAFEMAVAIFILMLYAGIEFRSRARTEMATMEHVLSEERKQFVQMKENIDIINVYCHDLKHQLADFSGRLTDQEIAGLQNAMEIYDSNIRTGSEALDVVLYLHQLTCRKEGITLTCLADGQALSFMRTRHIYALFNNAISNAVEAVRKIPDPQKRVIGLTVCRENGKIEMECTNYYEGTLTMMNGLPRTEKEDSGHHGFGTMSMRYIAEQYHGQMTVEARKGIYTLHITIPMGEKNKG